MRRRRYFASGKGTVVVDVKWLAAVRYTIPWAAELAAKLEVQDTAVHEHSADPLADA